MGRLLTLLGACMCADASTMVGFRERRTGLSRISAMSMHDAAERARLCSPLPSSFWDQTALLLAVVAVSDRLGVCDGEGARLGPRERLL